jgi:hemolysin activation/secretion protein
MGGVVRQKSAGMVVNPDQDRRKHRYHCDHWEVATMLVHPHHTVSARPLVMAWAGWLLMLAGLTAVAPVRAQADAAARLPAQRVPVEQFEIVGNTLLDPAELQAAVVPFKGQRNLDELKQAAAAVQARYRERGYGAVVAYLPPQDIQGGRVRISVLEGRLAQIVVSGNQRFSEANVRRSLPGLQPGTTPQVRELDAQIRLANENPARKIALTLEPGAAPGQVDAQVLVTEQSPRRWTLGLDNTGNTRTGRWRASVAYQDVALWDLDHQGSLQYQMAPDKPSAVTVLGLGYRMPLYQPGLMLDGFAGYSDVDGGVTSTAAGPLQFSGRGRMWSLRVTDLLQRHGELDQRVALSLNERAYLNDCGIAGLPAGVCGPAGASVTVRPLALEYSLQRDRAGSLGFSSVISHNFGWGGARASQADFDAARPGAAQRYTTVRLDAAASLPLRSWQWQTRLGGQWTAQALVPGEQFGIAGTNAVRGYEERELIGDRAAHVAFELYGPQWQPDWLGSTDGLRLLGFADAGRVWNRLDTPCLDTRSVCSLASVGLGGRFSVAGVQLRLDVAHALRPATRTARGDNRVHVLASYGF